MAKQISVLIPLHWRKTFDTLPDRDVAALVRGAMAIAAGDDPPLMRGSAAALWPLLAELTLKNQQKYMEVCQKRREAINKRWEKNKNTNESPEIHVYSNEYKSTDLNYNTNTNTNTKLSKDNISGKPGRLEIIEKWLKRSIGRQYRRRKNTAWSAKEKSALATIATRDGVLAECRSILRLYRNPGYQYQRRDIITLLNNWPGELDRAENFTKTQIHGGRSYEVLERFN